MSTSSITVFKESADWEGEEIAVLYRNMDGYPKIHGKQLAEFLAGSTMVNGIDLNEHGKVHNGMSCLAASVVAHFKHGAGDFYLYPAGTRDCDERYIYEVTGELDQEPTIRCSDDRGVEIFNGSASQVLAEITRKQGATK